VTRVAQIIRSQTGHWLYFGIFHIDQQSSSFFAYVI
jgi:hypothetical protein